MAELLSKSAFGPGLPIVAGTCELTAPDPGQITSVCVAAGQGKAVSAALRAACGVAFPAPNRATGRGAVRCVWVGPGQALLLGRDPGDLAGAALCDQTDGWAVLRLEGKDAIAVMARLVPVDLRASVFRRSHAARTLLFHMPVCITRSGERTFDLMVFRSMAHTAVQEIGAAMRSVAAQADL